MCQGAVRASCSPGRESWEPSVVARLAEAVASTTRSQDAKWHVRDQITPENVTRGIRSPAITQFSDQAGLRPSQEAEPAGPDPGQKDGGMSLAQAQLLRICHGAQVGPVVKPQLKSSSQGRGGKALAFSHLHQPLSAKELTLYLAS